MLRRLKDNSSGQALVEFAIVAPLIVMVILFSLWFYELVQIKLKVQEAARYAAWESTAYPLHDYKEGPQAEGKLRQQMTNSIMADTMTRYADLNSASPFPLPRGRLLAADVPAPPFAFVVDRPEERVPGGGVVNLIVSIAGPVFDFASALGYSSTNPIASALVGASKQNNFGGAMTDRMFGAAHWGFNRSGTVHATVTVMVNNAFANAGVGRFFLPNWGVVMTDQSAVLADSWKLNDGGDAYGDRDRPGVAENSAYWKQIDRMYLVNNKTRQTARGIINLWKGLMRGALAFTGTGNVPPELNDEDFVRPVVVSKPYSSDEGGQAEIQEDGGTGKKYDTAPVGLQGDGGESLKPYGQALKDRGEFYMGCERNMSLGCPSGTLQQDNPFGDYVIYEGGQ